MPILSTAAINQLREHARNVVRELGLLNDAYFEIGVTLAERHLLIDLSTHLSSTMGEVADRLLLDKSTVSRLISKAAKKGYITCVTDGTDKRRRILQLTDKGIQILHAFEPIAFNQTKEALFTLTPEEMATVYQGVALYAKGLKTSRLQKKTPQTAHVAVNDCKQIESSNELIKKLNLLGCTLEPFKQEDEEPLYEIFQEVVDSGAQFPYECRSLEEFHRQFFNPSSQVYVCHNLERKVVGGFYLRPNFSGRSKHIANAAYMIKGSERGKGIGSAMIKASLYLAKNCGFRAMQFNMVLSQNILAIKLYEKLGFNKIGTIPHAVRNPDGSYQDGYVMHRQLDDL